MPTYHRADSDQSDSRKVKGKRKSKRGKQQSRFEFTTPALLTPGLFRRSVKPKTARRDSLTKQTWRAISGRQWHPSHYVAGLLLIVTLAIFVYTFQSYDYFVYAADIENTHYTTTAETYAKAGIDGQSIFFINPEQVRERVLELPHVRDAEVSVTFPANVSISVTEREPMVLYQVLGQSYWIDREGFIAPAADQRQGLVKLVDDNSAASRDGHTDPALLDAVRRITQNLPEVSTFRYQEPYGLFFFSPEGWQVNLGSAERMDQKLAMWEAMRRDILKQGASPQLVDLRFERPYWR
ncbi:MAG: FtsQ-type POTRA domain-containing protein [Caldilineales bacterium]|nr:FtsQ-type POTRA domain-containing protein [Caldilineales bacterium]